MIRRIGKNLGLREGDACAVTQQLERDGYGVIASVFDHEAIEEVVREIEAVFAAVEPERSRADRAEFRYEMYNRSAACQAAIGHPAILEVIEPLLGEDCHVIANTAWRNPPDFPGGPVSYTHLTLPTILRV